MKIKDAVNVWLLVWTSNGNPLMREHYFPTKEKSACGKVNHPKSQPMALYIQNERCKKCIKIYKRFGVK